MSDGSRTLAGVGARYSDGAGSAGLSNKLGNRRRASTTGKPRSAASRRLRSSGWRHLEAITAFDEADGPADAGSGGDTDLRK